MPLSTSDLELTTKAPWLLASLYHTMGILMKWVFGIETDHASVLPALSVVITLALVSLAVLYRRVSSPMRA